MKSAILRWLLGIGTILYLLTLVDLGEFSNVLTRARASWILFAALTIFLDRCFMGLKWQILIRAAGVLITPWDCIRAYFVGSFFGLVLPTSVGSDLVRLGVVPARSGERGKIAASILVEKLLAMLALFLLVSLCVFALVWTSESPQWRYFFIATGVLLLSGAAFLVSFLVLPVERLERFQGKFAKKLVNVILAYHQYKRQHKAMFLFFILSFIEHFVPVLTNFLLAKSFGLPGSFLTYLLVVPIILTVARIPISVDGLGVMEALYLVLLPVVGLTKTDAFLLGIVARVVNTLALLAGGMFHFTGSRTRKSEI